MQEYRETTQSGSSYQRCRSMTFENPKGSPPSVYINEETIFNLGDQTVVKPCNSINRTITDFSTVFQLKNPLTNDDIPGATMTYQDLYVGLFSLYWHLATERDAMEEAARNSPSRPDPMGGGMFPDV